jgi:hypothetical protein
MGNGSGCMYAPVAELDGLDPLEIAKQDLQAYEQWVNGEVYEIVARNMDDLDEVVDTVGQIYDDEFTLQRFINSYADYFGSKIENLVEADKHKERRILCKR